MAQGFTLDTLHKQFQQFRAGGLAGIGLTELSAEDKQQFERAERILGAMTHEERKNVDLLLDEHVRRRIAEQSDTQLREVDELISMAARVLMMLRGFHRASRAR